MCRGFASRLGKSLCRYLSTKFRLLLGSRGFDGLFSSVVGLVKLVVLLGSAGIVYWFAFAICIPGIVGVLDLNAWLFAGCRLCLGGCEVSVNGVV